MISILNNNPNSLPVHILKVLEKDWGYKLPESYRKFLIENNGGEPSLDIFYFKGENYGSDLRSFLGVYPDDTIDILRYIKIYGPRIPDNMLPIAYDSFGNLILLAVKNADRGKIYFWDHELEAHEGEEPDYSNLTLIADSFDEFVSGLRDVDEESLGD